ncbi:hypothetical protein THAOC_02350 [Thalassiosira oceanica]|uniref:Uncharacterized protein n=1 Tax=Thalassiosira oceanica TaxID=159749 RepID=K0TFS5_THAOC|nr:hypothetical protein THAOC_02350 [Thalassiosira oceanica]|eukprot:EJK75909.1 hypothetical protein THAOC_02350 [Thalassiosira oceanica]
MEGSRQPPRVDPNDWASRRANAMSRARELRAKVSRDGGKALDSRLDSETNVLRESKEEKGNHGSSIADVATDSSYSIVSQNQLETIHNLTTTKTNDQHVHPPNHAATSPALLDPTSNVGVRETPMGEGRGRGRGRGRTIRSGSSGHSSHGTHLSQTSEIRVGGGREGRDVNAACVQMSDAAKAYLESRRVPDYKEGEEGKLALLREGLARARSSGKENNNRDRANERSTAIPIKLGRPDEDAESVVEIELIECEECGRSFAPKIFEKHWNDGQPRCLAAAKKRTVFNSAKARISNNSALNAEEREGVLAANKKAAKEMKRKKKRGGNKKKGGKSKWEAQSQEFREAMKANRLISKAESEGKPAHYYL